jgi:polyisoprenoid-binding protein YceI
MFKRLSVLMAVMILITGSAMAQTWNIEKVHSSVGFSVRHLVIGKVNGYFRDFDAKAVFDGKNIEAGSVEATVKIASIDTDNPDRDKHLSSPDFFDAVTYPTMTFKSKKITKGAGDAFTMIGDLTIKDVTKEVTFTGEFNGVINDPWGNIRAGMTASTTINRQDFNVSWANKLQDGSMIVGNDVGITLEVELTEAKEAGAEGK